MQVIISNKNKINKYLCHSFQLQLCPNKQKIYSNICST